MKFEKIIIPPGWKDTFTKYPNGRTIFEALSHTITTVNEGIEEVNQKVDQGLLAIDQAENIIRDEITDSFNTLKLQLEGEIDDLSSDLIADFALLQSDVLTLIAGKANASDVYTKQQVDAQLAEKVSSVNGVLPDVNGNVTIEAGGGSADINDSLTALDSTWSSTKIDVTKADKAQLAYIKPTLLAGCIGDVYLRKTTLNQLEMFGEITIGTVAYGTPLFNIPAGYNVKYTAVVPTLNYSSGNIISCALNPSGTFAAQSVIATGNKIRFAVILPLEN